MAEDEMVVQYHQPNGHRLEQTPGDGGAQGSLHAVVHGNTKRQTRLSNSTMITTFTFIIPFNFFPQRTLLVFLVCCLSHFPVLPTEFYLIVCSVNHFTPMA